MEQLHALDTAFLHAETAEASLHIGSVGIFEGPAPDFADIQSAVEAKLHRVPRWRQRLRHLPFEIIRPVWADAPDFDLDDHLHHLQLPEPGGMKELHEAVDWVLSQHLDLALPLWEAWVITGLEDNSWTLVTKIHHSMVDGIAGTGMLSALLDSDRDAAPSPLRHWEPVDPGVLDIVAGTVRRGVLSRLGDLRTVVRSAAGLSQPRRLAERAVSTGRGLLGLASAGVPTGASPLIGPLGRDRLHRWTSVPIDDILAVKTRFGVTVNDVVLAAMAQGYRTLLQDRGEPSSEDAVRILVPVSVRHRGQSGDLDNRVSAILLDLPVDIADARDRLIETSLRMRRLKDANEAGAGEMLVGLGDDLPSPLLAAGLHVAFRLPHRHLTSVVTTVPGPPERLYLLGRRMVSCYPYVPLANRVRAGIAVTWYEAEVLVGVTTDKQSVPEADRIIDGIEQGFAELSTLARSVPEGQGVAPCVGTG